MALNNPTCAYLDFYVLSKKFEFLDLIHFLKIPAVYAVNTLEAL